MPIIGGVGGTDIWTAYAATNVDQDFTYQAWINGDNVQTVSIMPGDVVTVHITLAFKSTVDRTYAAAFRAFIGPGLGESKRLGAHTDYGYAVSLVLRRSSNDTGMWSCGYEVYVVQAGSTITVLDSEIIVVRYR